MAKMFYTLDETKAALGRSEDEIKNYAREGRLREFRDGARLMYKADQVEQLKREVGGGAGGSVGGDAIDLAGETGAGASGIGMLDTRGGTGAGGGSASGISLADTGSGLTGSGLQALKDDTNLSADLGLSGSLGGLSSPGRSAAGSVAGLGASGAGGSILGGSMAGSMAGGSMAGTGAGGLASSKAGINVFGDDDAGGRADPMAQTNISAGARDQIALEGVGSGSGLLDLTRESDDTSLGAELLDEIQPGQRRGGTSPGGSVAASPPPMAGVNESAGTMGPGISTSIAQQALVNVEPPRAATSGRLITTQIEQADPLAPAFGGAALGAAVVLAAALFALLAGAAGYAPGFVKTLAGMGFAIVSVIFIGVAILFFVGGLLAGRVMR